ncbi:MAG: hypothetical protein JNK94_07110 [Hyphomonadaceae bacterium]|nr:hypothetical protein [Hyphomonadaceae bacterium]MBX3510412.1 hypothetical protein [Hyphomonadaceae bacterium]
MVRTPKNLAEAKQIVREEKRKLTTSISAIAGSRWLMAILATFTLAFGNHLIFARERLPTVHGLSLAEAGLPPGLDFGLAGEQLEEARAAARRENVAGRIQEEIAALQNENADVIPTLNWIGFGAALALLLGNMTIMTMRRRTTRG